MMEKLKLNLGSGSIMLKDYVNIDFQNQGEFKISSDLTFLKMNIFDVNKYFLAGTVNEIRAFHFMEHFTGYEVINLLYKFYLLLGKDGILNIRTPDFYNILQKYKSKHEKGDFSDIDLLHIKVFNEDDETVHKTIWYEEIGKYYLEREGFFRIKKVWHPTDIEIQFDCIKL